MSEHNAPGWQADPTGRHEHRYWDGNSWTDNVADAGVAGTDAYDAGSTADAPTVIDQPAPTPATDPTAATAAPEDSTSTWATTPPPAPPSYATPTASAEEPPSSKKGMLIGGGILAIVVVALIAFFAFGGDDDDDRSSIHSQLVSELRDDGDLTKAQADCVANHIIDEVGVKKLKGVDLSADGPPDALAAEMGDAAFSSFDKCDINPSTFGDDDDMDADDGDSLTPDDFDELDDADGFDDLEGFDDLGPDFSNQLAEVYAGMGISPAKAKCLADKIADAVSGGNLEAEDAMSEFFTFFSACDINPSELGG